jgi:peptidoglycan hydrolase CwlO-like protein
MRENKLKNMVKNSGNIQKNINNMRGTAKRLNCNWSSERKEILQQKQYFER